MNEASPRDWRAIVKKIGYGMAAVWIFGGASFYFVRFTSQFYLANQASIDGVLEGIRRAVSGE